MGLGQVIRQDPQTGRPAVKIVGHIAGETLGAIRPDKARMAVQGQPLAETALRHTPAGPDRPISLAFAISVARIDPV